MKRTNYKTLLALAIFLSILIWNSGRAQNRDGIDTVATLNTFAPVGEFYKMDYTGNYNELLDIMDDIYAGGRSGYEDFKCSLFSAKGDTTNLIFGRNFDNPENDVMLVRYHPPDGYTSMAFTRMSDMGYAVGTNYPNLTFQQKLHLLKCAYFVPDGINEHGLAAGLAWHQGITYTIDPAKDTIFITRLIREILDHASNIQEALDIANSYNVCDAAVNVISHHVLVGTATGESVTLEYSGGEFRAVTSDSAWQVLTNIPVYNIPHSQLMANCWRYNSLYNCLQEHKGILSWDEGMDALEAVHMNCPWSAIYELNNKALYVAINNNYDDIAYTDLENFDFTIYVGVPDPGKTYSGNRSLRSFPNPFIEKTQIKFNISETEQVIITVFDRSGKQMVTLADEVFTAGEHSISWDGRDTSGNQLPSGIYLCSLKSGKHHQTIQMVLNAR